MKKIRFYGLGILLAGVSAPNPFLPIYEEILSQFAANLILHLPAENAKITAIECYEQYQFDPCFYHSFYNPEADSEAIKSRQDPVQVRNTLLLFFEIKKKFNLSSGSGSEINLWIQFQSRCGYWVSSRDAR
mgnify:CR=1 FL=1